MTWNLDSLEGIFKNNESWAVVREEGCLCITNEDGLDAYIAVSGEQIIVEAILFAKMQVSDVNALNDEILKTHQVFPLTTIGITAVDGEEYYIAFGALSSQSKEESIIIEVQALFDNISGFLDAYEDYIN